MSNTRTKRAGQRGSAIRYNAGKPVLSMVFEAPHALTGVAEVLEFGAEKYSRGNWREGMSYTWIIDSLLRHTLAFHNGEDLDAETGLPHVDHMLCNVLFLAELYRIFPDGDDRVSTEG